MDVDNLAKIHSHSVQSFISYARYSSLNTCKVGHCNNLRRHVRQQPSILRSNTITLCYCAICLLNDVAIYSVILAYYIHKCIGVYGIVAIKIY